MVDPGSHSLVSPFVHQHAAPEKRTQGSSSIFLFIYNQSASSPRKCSDPSRAMTPDLSSPAIRQQPTLVYEPRFRTWMVLGCSRLCVHPAPDDSTVVRAPPRTSSSPNTQHSSRKRSAFHPLLRALLRNASRFTSAVHRKKSQRNCSSISPLDRLLLPAS